MVEENGEPTNRIRRIADERAEEHRQTRPDWDQSSQERGPQDTGATEETAPRRPVADRDDAVSDEDAVAHRRSSAKRRSAWVMTALALLLATAFAYALIYNLSGKADEDARKDAASRSAASSSSSTTTTAAAPLVDPATVKVNVFNGTSKSGLARKTGDQLAAQGFRIVTVGNEKPVQGVGVIRFGATGKNQAAELAKRFPGATLAQDGRKDDTVDVVVGPKFTAVTNPGGAPASGSTATGSAPQQG